MEFKLNMLFFRSLLLSKWKHIRKGEQINKRKKNCLKKKNKLRGKRAKGLKAKKRVRYRIRRS